MKRELRHDLPLEYQVEADFYPLTTCNFRCTYCFLPPAALGAKIAAYGTNEEWRDGFDATGKTWLIHATGGEPFIYPGFVALCEQLTRRHYLSINSNLSPPSVEEFAARIDPARVAFIHGSVHYQERQRRGTLEILCQRARALDEAGFAVMLSLVMTPEIVGDYAAIAELFATRGLTVIPKILRGWFAGRLYPQSYSVEHKERLRQWLAAARTRYAPWLDRMSEPPTVDLFEDARFLDGYPNYHGRMCGSGHNFVQVRQDGSVLRCGSGEHLGNVLRRTVRLLNAPKPCNASYCPYFCEKYTSPRFSATSLEPADARRN